MRPYDAALAGSEVGTIIDASHVAVVVQYGWGRLVCYRDEVRRAR